MFTLLLPDVALIVLGFVLSRTTGWGREFWTGLEKINYNCLFPALLFVSIVRNPIRWDTAGPMLVGVWAVILLGALLAVVGGWLLRPDPVRLSSGMQCAYRFNTFIFLAVTERVGGSPAAGLAAMCVGAAVPLANLLAVTALARHSSKGTLREIVTNPLILATVGGGIVMATGVPLPQPVEEGLSRLGSAAIALGLVSVGAGLTLAGAKVDRGLAAWITGIRVLALPAAVLLLAPMAGIGGLPLMTLVTFAAIPTATSAYVLAARMGGDGPYTAFLVSVSTVAAMISAPVWLSLAGRV